MNKSSLFSAEKQIEFCCHLARGNLDPNEPITYEHVKFVVDFKYFTHGKPLRFSFCLSPFLIHSEVLKTLGMIGKKRHELQKSFGVDVISLTG